MIKPETYRGHLNGGGKTQSIACAPIPPSSTVDMFPSVAGASGHDAASRKSTHGSVPAGDSTNSQDLKQPHHYHPDAHPIHGHQSIDGSRRTSKVVCASQMMHEENTSGHQKVIVIPPPTIPCPALSPMVPSSDVKLLENMDWG